MGITRMKRTLFASLFVIAVLSAMPALADEKSRMIFATQESGTFYYSLGAGFSKLLSRDLERKVTVQPCSGSSVYLLLLDNGEAALGFSSSLDSGDGYRGVRRTPLGNLRAIARIWSPRVA